MPIVSSEFILDSHTQRDGSRWCRERFTLHDGRLIQHERHIPANAQPDQATFAAAKFAEHLASMPKTLAQNEVKGIIFGGLPFVLVEQTKAEFAESFWTTLHFLEGQEETAARALFEKMVWWLYQRVQAGDITNNEARLSFNMVFERSLTSQQWNTFVSDRLLPIVIRHEASVAETPL